METRRRPARKVSKRRSAIPRMLTRRGLTVLQTVLSSHQFQLSLAVIDADVAQQAQEGGCVVCGARLHRADYPRKPPVGVTTPEEGVLCLRTSFCCADRDCRKRVTPPSLRFFARRHYLSLFVVLAAILVNGASPRRVREVARSIAVDRRTLERWRDWWTKELPRTSLWQSLRGRFDRPVDEARLPMSLLDRFTNASEECRLRKMFELLRALSLSEPMRARLMLDF
jgi:hypothetical protein